MPPERGLATDKWTRNEGRTLERNVVVADARVGVFGWRGRLWSWRALRGTGHGYGGPVEIAGGGASARAAGIAAAAKQNQFVANNFREVLLLPVLVIVAAGRQPSFDVYLLAFQQVIRQIFGSPQQAVVPI